MEGAKQLYTLVANTEATCIINKLLGTYHHRLANQCGFHKIKDSSGLDFCVYRLYMYT